MQKNHYSYTVYADPQIAQTFDCDRFGGKIGEEIKLTQEKIVFSALGDVKGWKILDLGAGTGRMTIPLLDAGAKVTACDASSQMLEVLKQKTSNADLTVSVADAHQLEFPDQTFDCSLSFRMLLHVIEWKKALAELCRISKDWLVFDFPPRHGFLLLTPIRHRIHKMVKGSVQAYRTLPLREVKEEIGKNGFQIVKEDPGFFLPLVIYRTSQKSRTDENFREDVCCNRLD